MRNTLPKKIRKREAGVVNLDTSDGIGTHWVCYVKNGDEVKYYDSFASPPPLELEHYFGQNSVILYNFEQEQKIDEVTCGHLCLKFLDKNR